MEVLKFISDNGIDIRATTAVDINRLWFRFRARVGSYETAMGYCDYHSTLTGKLELAMPDQYNTQRVGEEGASEWKELPPVFYETAAYNFTIRFRNLEGKPKIVHRMKEVSDLFTGIEIGADEWLLAGQIDFQNEPGTFALTFSYQPKGERERSDTLTFRVVSPKLDVRQDYNYLLADINRSYNEIVFKYLTKTVQNLAINGRSNNNVVWLSIFRTVVEQYIKAVAIIVNRPHLRERKEVRYSNADHIKHWTPQMARQYAEEDIGRTLDSAYFRHEVTENTSNTRENRFVKFTLDKIGRRLDVVFNELKENATKHGCELSESELAELDDYQKRLRKLKNSPLLRNLRGEPLRSESIVLQKRTGYSQVYRYWLILQKGIELHEDSNRIGVRPIWELYELWCFLKMRFMIADILGLDFANPGEIQETPLVMIEPFSESEATHTVTYFCGEDIVTLGYQHTFNRKSGEVHTATTDNRPDIVLTIKKPNGFELTYLYDAKYRVTDDSKLSDEDQSERNELNQHGADYPPSDAINQMHRYRDAIYYGEKKDNQYGYSAKEIIGGYILFPGRGDDESVKKRYYYKSIETVNIGAFPLLPDHNNPASEGTLLHQHLTKILVERTAYQQIKDSIPQRGLLYTPAVVDSNDLVLVGYYKTEQLDIIRKNRLYYVPAGLGKGSINLATGFESTKYLLLHHDERHRELLELTGNGPRFYPATQLQQMGFNPTGDYYLGFHIKSLTPINIPGLDLDSLDLYQMGQQSYRPYFTTFKKLQKN